MRLLLVRHGEALSSDIDPNQSLSPSGVEETESVARLLKRAALEIDEIIHSTKLRAKQTAEIVGTIVAPDVTLIEHEQMKPNDSIEPLVSEITTFDRNVVLVGHLPFLEKLSTYLLLGEERNDCFAFAGSTMVALQGERENWMVEWMLNPTICSRSS